MSGSDLDAKEKYIFLYTNGGYKFTENVELGILVSLHLNLTSFCAKCNGSSLYEVVSNSAMFLNWCRNNIIRYFGKYEMVSEKYYDY